MLGVGALGTLAAATCAQAAGHPYVALGDSYTVGWEGSGQPGPGFVTPLFTDYKASLGAGELFNTGVPGESSSSIISGGQLSNALADIGGPSDTRAVTLEIGGADALLSSSCTGHFDEPGTCSFRANFHSILTQLQAALLSDPGAESLIVATYPNPSAGTGTPTEDSRDLALLGANGTVGCADTGSNVGLNDAIFQEAGTLGIPVANPYPAFEQHGQSYVSTDNLHPNDDGYAAIAEAFRHATTPCGATPDRQPPDTEIRSGPVRGTHDRTPTFKLRSSEPGSKFKCTLDGGKAKSCGARYTTPKLSFGKHTLSVAAKDPAGNVDPAPAKASFKVVK